MGMSIVMTDRPSNPGSTARNVRKLRTSNAAPITSITASAISDTTNTPPSRRPLGAEDDPLLRRSTASRSTCRTCRAGASPKKTPVTMETECGECEDTSVDERRGAAGDNRWERARELHEQGAQSDHRKRDAEHTTDHREHQALGQELPDDLPSARTGGQPDRHLALSRDRPDEKQMRRVDANDQQHERDCAKEQQQGRPDVSHHDGVEWLNIQAGESGISSGNVRRIAAVAASLCALANSSDAPGRRRAAANSGASLRLSGSSWSGIHRSGRDSRDTASGPGSKPESRTPITSCDCPSSKRRCPKHVRCRVHVSLPELVTDDHNRGAVRTILVRREGAAARRPRTEEREEIGAHTGRADLLHQAVAVQRHRAADPVRGGALDGVCGAAPGEELRRGDTGHGLHARARWS